MKSFYIETYGCQMNKADSEAMTGQLQEEGYTKTADCNEADFIIINTCSVRKTAENRIWGRLGFFKNLKTNTNAVVVVVGCMSQRLGNEIIQQDSTVDIVVGTYFKNSIPRILTDYTHGEKLVFVEEKALTFFDSIPDSLNPRKSFVTISHGCNNYCTYCIVPYLRGAEQSRPSQDIIEDIQRLQQLGVKQVTLLGQNVNSYARDTGDLLFSDLLKMICRETDIEWIKFLSSHPKDLGYDLIEVMADEDRIGNWLHLAVQSGSNSVLSGMNRTYTIDKVYNQVKRLRAAIPDINLTTDILVGFPGEQESDFEETVKLLREIEFDDAYLYKYNIREGTVAADTMQDDVPETEKGRRLSYVIDLQRAITRQKREARVGTQFCVMAEKWSKKATNKILGLTREDLMIIYDGNRADFDKIVDVRAVSLEGNTLQGVKI